MLIDAIRFQGYRSLRDVEFRPGRLTCLVGANGAGKSNLVVAFKFVRNAYDHGLGSAVLEENGFDAIAWRGAERADEMAFTVEARVPLSALEAAKNSDENGHQGMRFGEPAYLAVRHHFALQRQSEGVFSGFSIVAEQVEIFAGEADASPSLVRGSRSKDGGSYEYKVGRLVDPPEPNVPLNLLDSGYRLESEKLPLARTLPPLERELAIASHRFFSPTLDYFLGELSRIRPYNVVPEYCRWQGSPVPNGELMPNGLGLPTAVAVLQARYPTAWEDVLDSFFQLVPAFADVQVEQESDGRLALRFFEEERSDAWHARQVSDGTLRSLALLVALFDPRHRVVLVEEPENSLHPWAIRLVLAACRKAVESYQKQVVLTTHSPVVIDRMRPEELSVVWSRSGETRISPLTERDPDAHRLWEEGSADLSGLLDSGWVRESVPLFGR